MPPQFLHFVALSDLRDSLCDPLRDSLCCYRRRPLPFFERFSLFFLFTLTVVLSLSTSLACTDYVSLRKGTGKRGHIVADTLLPTQMFPRLQARATFVADTILCPGHKKCFLFCSETFCVRNKCFPVCARKETS